MTKEEVQLLALALPAATKVVQWGGSDVYKVGGKVFAICGLSEALSFKVTEVGFMVLTDEGAPGRQARYLAKGQWVSIDLDAMEAEEVADWLTTSHELIVSKLTRKARAELGL